MFDLQILGVVQSFKNGLFRSWNVWSIKPFNYNYSVTRCLIYKSSPTKCLRQLKGLLYKRCLVLQCPRNYRYTGTETRQTFLVCCDSKELFTPTLNRTPVGDQHVSTMPVVPRQGLRQSAMTRSNKWKSWKLKSVTLLLSHKFKFKSIYICYDAWEKAPIQPIPTSCGYKRERKNQWTVFMVLNGHSL